jgi:hypothetical protein
MTRRVAIASLLCLALAAACSTQAEDAEPATETQTEAVPEAQTATAPEAENQTEAGTEAQAEAGAEVLFPDVIEAQAIQAADGSWTFAATLSSPYDTPERYADAWRVVGPDGEVYGVRELAHDHQNEQPFTRSQSGIVIPDEVDTVTVQGRDQLSGWGGATFEVSLTP